MTFDDFRGHETVKHSLLGAILSDRVSNAYVFEGISGVGKKLCAKIFAQALVCCGENPPCGQCDPCRQAQVGVLPDIIYLKKKTGEASVGVDDIREQIIPEVFIKPRATKRKVFVIEQGDELNDACQNALLKVLEEPPDYVTFIICVTSKEKLLPTVLSRSQSVTFFPLSEEVVTDYVMDNYDIDEKSAKIYARLAQGSIGQAKALAEDSTKYEKIQKATDAVISLKKKSVTIREVVEYLTEEKENIAEILQYFMTFLRDCVLIKSDMEQQVVFADKISEIRVFVSDIPKARLISAFDKLCDLNVRLKQNLNFNASVSETVMRIWEDFHDEGSGH